MNRFFVNPILGALHVAHYRSEEAAKRSDMLIAQLTTQFDRAQRQLEDLPKRAPFWQRVFGKNG